MHFIRAIHSPDLYSVRVWLLRSSCALGRDLCELCWSAEWILATHSRRGHTSRQRMNDFHARTDCLNNRRDFLRTSGVALGAAALAGLSNGSAAAAEAFPPAPRALVKKGQTILFQGDSITDAGRSREKAGEANSQAGLGNGYAAMTAAGLLVDRPQDNLKIYNRGISGNKVFQLAERWDADCLGLKPDVLSILIGVNDLWHTLDGKYKGTVEIYEHDYRALLERTLKALPKVRLVVCEPFLLRCGAVSSKWFPQFDTYRVAARKVAHDFKATFVPFQAMFDEAVEICRARSLGQGRRPPERGGRLAHGLSLAAGGGWQTVTAPTRSRGRAT